MSRRLIIILFFTVIYSNLALGKNCYLLVTNSGEFNQEIVLEMGISLISQFFEPVEPIPPGGISQKACLYNVTVIKGKSVRAVSISGPTMNAYGDSTYDDIKGLQHSFLKAILRASPTEKVKICKTYQNILLDDCKSLMIENQKKRSLIGVWMTRDLDEDMEFYINIKENNTVSGCEIYGGDYKDDYEGKIVEGTLIWDSDDKDKESHETFTLSIINDSLVSIGEEIDSYERVSKLHPECNE